MDYIKYQKFIIPLQCKLPDSSASGQVSIETGNNRGSLILKFSGLPKDPREKMIYKLMLFGDNCHCTIGGVPLNRYGTGDYYYRISPQDICCCGLPLDCYSSISIVAFQSGCKGAGFQHILSGALPFQRRPQQDRNTAETKAVTAESSIHNEQSKNKFETEPERTEAEDKSVSETGGGVIPAVTEESPICNEQSESKFETETERAEAEDKSVSETEWAEAGGAGVGPVVYNSYYNEYLLNMLEKLSASAEYCDTVHPFTNSPFDAILWKRIVSTQGFPMLSPDSMWAQSKYRHYIFAEDEEHYYIGIPGRNLPEEQPERGASGFVFWLPIAGSELSLSMDQFTEEIPLDIRLSSYGYWIGAIEKTTGNIVNPVA